ncbi:hypothetical protein M5K25_000548 [Dendrobium thyrsiflorum]|uniref:Uncharacterized protein n=1 Tax=Dendrobium thyrsiflorum TaxID=117978 RepID=A0ABD0W7B6_DENTH
MTPLLSIITYMIMSNTPFDEAQLILNYIHNLTDIRHPQTKRKKNIALGHLVSYVLEKKYGLTYPKPPTEEPIFFTNASFRSLFLENQPVGEEEAEGEAAPEPEPGPNQNAYQEILNRFGAMEAHFDQHFDQIELRMKAQEDQHNADMAGIHGQIDYINTNVAMINSYFTAFNPQPPPDLDLRIRHLGSPPSPGSGEKGGSGSMPLPRSGEKGRGSLPSPRSGEKGCGSLPSPRSGEKGCGSLPSQRSGEKGHGSLPLPRSGEKGHDSLPSPRSGEKDVILYHHQEGEKG